MNSSNLLKPDLKILISAEHASAKFGGEAALPLHYFRILNRRGHQVWLVTHSRVREEVIGLFPDALERMVFIEDDALHVFLWRLGSIFPNRLAYFTTGFISRIHTQLAQRRLVRQWVREKGIQLVHQPIPVSPREPSLLHDLAVPVIIGPLNGGMDYPPAFRVQSVRWISWAIGFGRLFSNVLNRLMPGKIKAQQIFVANERSRLALPQGLKGTVTVLPENGVDLALWGYLDKGSDQNPKNKTTEPRLTRFVHVGRLVDVKAVDILFEAFALALQSNPYLSLTLIGDGDQGESLRNLAKKMGLAAQHDGAPGQVYFAGWKTQQECAAYLGECDVLTLTSLAECGGAVVLEAMACGLPVISTAWGGPLDYLDETCGVLVAPDSRAALARGFADAMLRLAESPELCRQMGANGRAKVEAEFDWERKIDRMLQTYAELVEKGVRSP